MARWRAERTFMETAKIKALHSENYLAINRFFASHEPPFTLTDIQEFNALYRLAYPALAPIERKRSEEWVDYLIDHVEHPEWVGKIYGVV
jgi:hypothetical protein